MNCRAARRLFGAYWDDEITLGERDWLESHFAACAACRGEYEEFARAIELVGSLPRAEAQPDLAARALARSRRAGAVPDRLPLGTPRWIPVTATAALLTIAATTALQWMGIGPARRDAPPPEVPTLAQPALTAPVAVQPAGPDAADQDLPLAGGPFPGGVPDSLFDRSADVEFILDPVVLRKGRAHTVLKLNPAIQGEKAVITF